MFTAEQASRNWDNAQHLVQIEEGRYTTQRALQKIIGEAFQDYVDPSTAIYEVGAGTGYLKDLVPPIYHPNYTSTDFNLGNLKEGQKRRDLKIQQADAYALPFEPGAVDCVVDMDAYDTLLNLRNALGEVTRVLKPGGTYIHFQINSPSDDTVWVDYPDHIFFPTKNGTRVAQKVDMVGLSRDALLKGLEFVTQPTMHHIFDNFLKNPIMAYMEILLSPRSADLANLLIKLIDLMPVNRLQILSLPAYFKSKLEKLAVESGLTIVNSEFRATSVIAERSEVQRNFPQFNQFSMEQGMEDRVINGVLKISGSNQVIEKASILTFVAQKPTE